MNVVSIFNVMDEIRDLQKLFTTAQEQLRQGKVVDMAGVDIRITKVCKAAQQAMPEQQQMYLPELTVLIELLNVYEADLRSMQAALQESKPGGSDDGKPGA